MAATDLWVEMDWRQRSRQLWLAAGDANTRFFHQAANGRRLANRIKRLRMGDRVITSQAAVGRALADNFRGFFKRGPPNSWRWTGAGASCLSLDEQGSIIGPFLVDEVRAAINGLNAEGASGPDGISVFFYRDYWDQVAPDVMALMKEFYAGTARMDNINRAYIALLPKVHGAEQVGDFRPISLSNSIYLIIAKVLANCLRRLLQSHINSLQFAFVSGMQMLDTIIIAEEIIAEWKRSDIAGFVWKVDFAKAYDSLDWHFLWNMFKRRGFPTVWIKWMKQCVCTTTFAVLVNGRPQGGWIHPQRGIKQGCPLAPLLFILSADTLAICTHQLCMRGYLSGFQSSRSQASIPLLQYANDTCFFLRGSVAAAHHVSSMIDTYSDFFGLQLNRAKSTVVGIGMSSEVLAQVFEIFSTLVASLPIRYLGIPLTEGRMHNADWQPVTAKIEARLGGWQARLLSRGGHLVLFQSVLTAIPTYFMAVFRMPEGVRRWIECSMRRFFWQGARTPETRGWH